MKRPETTPRATTGGPSRRSQAERRAATQSALLQAALVSLVEDGYAGTTSRAVAARAGVSPGAQQHYFASKHEFALETMRYALGRLTTDALHRIDFATVLDPDKHEALLDEIWRLHQSNAFKAALELWNAARADHELRAALRTLEREVTTTISGTARALVPTTISDPSTLELLDIALATIRGYAMLAPVVPQTELNRRWKTARTHLTAVLRAHLIATEPDRRTLEPHTDRG